MVFGLVTGVVLALGSMATRLQVFAISILLSGKPVRAWNSEVKGVFTYIN